MSDDDDIVHIKKEDVLSEPYTDEDGMVDLLLAEDDAKLKIPPDVIDEGIETECEVGELKIKRKKKGKIVTHPEIELDKKTISDIDMQIKNSPSTALSMSVRKNNVLQKFIGNPVENDNLVDVVRKEASTSTILQAVMEEMAEEAAFIKAWRNENYNGEVDLSEATSKRIKMLRDLVDTVSEREKLKKEKNVGKVDFYGDNFQRVMKYFLEVIQKTVRKVNIPSQFEDIFFTQLAKEFDGFEKSAEKIYYGKE